jgi:hypothetical protein
MHYFANDGQYGDSTDLVILHTEDWTPQDWDLIFDCTDDDRAKVAISISKSKKALRLLGL